jgi:hypothetical protein
MPEETFRVVLVHLHVEVPRSDTRDADAIADAIGGAIEVGSDDDSMRGLTIAIPLAEEES